MSRALVLTYHAVEAGEGPLFVSPRTFAAQLDRIVESGADAVAISELGELLRTAGLRRPTVAITFDDGIASVARVAAPLLAERGLPATIFCVAGHLGRRNDWSSARPGGPDFALAGAAELAELVAVGFEIGSHGMTHAPLISSDSSFLRRELIEAAETLREATGVRPTSYAYPYGAAPTTAGRSMVEATYAAACTTALGEIRRGADVFALSRVDAHYVRRPFAFSRALDGTLDAYLGFRRIASRGRRAIREDYLVPVEDGGGR